MPVPKHRPALEATGDGVPRKLLAFANCPVFVQGRAARWRKREGRMTQPVRQDDKPTFDASCISAQISVSSSAYAHPPVVSSELDRITHSVRDAVGEQNFHHWFLKRTRFEISGDRLIVRVPNPFILGWLLRRFRTSLNQAAQLVLGPSATSQLEVDESLMLEVADEFSAASKTASAAVISGVMNSGAIDNDVKLRRDAGNGPLKTIKNLQPLPAVASEFDRPGSLSLPGNRRRFRCFDSFISGECNDLAVLAARQVSATPGERYNPLFIHGGTGTGKTHLLEAIYTEVRRKHSEKNVMYLTCEAFTNYFTAALSSRTVPSFRQRFRNVEVLLIDNIEFLDNKRATQEEFLHTITQLIDHGGQVVISSDRHPRLLTKHREELTTRFMSGLVCRIESPDEATRYKLARSLIAGMKAVFADDALEYVVRRCRRNIRELQGALNQLEGQFALNGRRITLTVAREILGEMAEECRRLVRISDVEKVVCDVFGVTVADLRSASRRKAIALPRAVAMFMSRRMTKSAYREIGMYFGGRDHSTVVAAERKVAEWVTIGEPIGLPTSCSGRTIGELIDELENRLQNLAC
jgi:chromosomal replication initiator protein